MKKSHATRRKQTKKTKLIAGIAWYTEFEWARVKATAIDPERFENSYAEWLEMAEEALGDIEDSGTATEKFLIHADKLHVWCMAQGVENEADSRARYVSENMEMRSPGPGS